MFSISKEQRLFILFGLFISFLIAMNVLGGKIIPLGPFSTSVAFLIVPWSFLVTDIVEEVYGKGKAREMIVAGVVALIVFLSFILLFVALPPASRFKQNEEYNVIFGTSARIVFASITAFLLSQFHDMWSFWKLRSLTKKRFLWFRTNVSTIFSMVIDTFVFMFLAFYMLTPMFTFWFVIQMIIPYLIFKMVWGVASTPLVYLGANWLRCGRKE
ncbi:MAG: queuosine precursor transporter [Candidatus Levybacteria bacterium]|nr:queuosine precursor transporter [Candidatus Levybacteria bacterium]